MKAPRFSCPNRAGVSTQPLAFPNPDPGIVIDQRDNRLRARRAQSAWYNAGNLGVFGPNTRQAIRAFQKYRSCPDGRLTLSLAAKSCEIFISCARGSLVYARGNRTVAVEREVQCNAGTPYLVPSAPLALWPEAARAGLDWAISHASTSASSREMFVRASTKFLRLCL